MNAVRARLAKYGLHAKKSWGQNFLIDEQVLERIADAAKIQADDVVVEIGPGLGSLTDPLLARARQVIAAEADPDMIAVLQQEFAGNEKLRLAPGDALKFDYAQARAEAGRPLVVVGNLPYQITSPLLFGIAQAAGAGQTIARGVFMVQREFAERMAAPPGDKIYGRLSVMMQQQAQVEILFNVGAHCFIPQPRVTSTVFRLTPRAQPRAAVRDAGVFEEVVRAAFGTRRKMLRKAMENLAGFSSEIFDAAKVEGTRRAEELAIEDFARLADALVDRRPPAGVARA